MIITKMSKNFIYVFALFCGSTFSCLAQESIFSISFGTGATESSRSPLNPADGTTTLKYAPIGTTSGGTYTLLPNPYSFGGGGYHSGEDHTPGDINGYMMILDVHSKGLLIYKKNVEGLCTNTKYEFSVWIANLANAGSFASRATFNIRNSQNNALIASETSNLIPVSRVLTWDKVSIIFTIPDSSVNSLTFEIVSGMDYVNHNAYDDILFEALKPNIKISNLDPVVCAGENVSMECLVEANFYSNAAVYQWQKKNTVTSVWENIIGATNKNYIANNVTETTQYRMLVSEIGNIENIKCRSASGVNTVTVNPQLVANISDGITICSGNGTNIVFTGTPNAEVKYTVNAGIPNAITLNSDGHYNLYTGILTDETIYEIVNAKDPVTNCQTQITDQKAVIALKPLPTATIMGSREVCKDEAFPEIIFTGSGGTPPYVFTYKENGILKTVSTENDKHTATIKAPTDKAGTLNYELMSVTAKCISE
ncbi:hypothetical protein SAMN04487979_105202 [Flavobacterium sp. ov086]|nr:hypothetical protein SAMN04487979_105202 [Flavobacterium sp. ov086]